MCTQTSKITLRVSCLPACQRTQNRTNSVSWFATNKTTSSPPTMLYPHHPYKYNQCIVDTIILLNPHLPGVYNGRNMCGHGGHHTCFLCSAQGQGLYLKFNMKVVATFNQVRIFDDVRLEEHHKDLLLFDSNNRLVTTGHLGRLLSDSIHP